MSIDKLSTKNTTETTIYLHIGQNKTGTTAIQKFLDVNRKILFDEFDVLYPNFSSSNFVEGVCNNHTSWYKSLNNNREKLIKDLNNLILFTKEHSMSKIVLSSEAWFLHDEVIRSFNYLMKEVDQIKLKPICYLRRIDHWVESAWKQWGIKEYDNFDEFFEQPRFYRMYQNAFAHLSSWAELIPIENIIVRAYEKNQLKDGLISDFLKILGIDYDSYKWIEVKKDNQSVNSGFNRDVLEILHYCRELYTDVHDNRYFNLFSDLLGEEFQKKPFEPYEFLSPQQRWKLHSINLPFEKKIAEKFMGRKDGKIFYDPLPDPNKNWKPYEGLTLEKAIPVIIKLIEGNNRKLNQLQKLLRK